MNAEGRGVYKVTTIRVRWLPLISAARILSVNPNFIGGGGGLGPANFLPAFYGVGKKRDIAQNPPPPSIKLRSILPQQYD